MVGVFPDVRDAVGLVPEFGDCAVFGVAVWGATEEVFVEGEGEGLDGGRDGYG